MRWRPTRRNARRRRGAGDRALRDLQRAANEGDPQAALFLDGELKRRGMAGAHYARMLLDLQPAAWRDPTSPVGTSGAWGVDVELTDQNMYAGPVSQGEIQAALEVNRHRTPCLFYYLDRPPQLEHLTDRAAEKGLAAHRPSIGLNLPDGYGHPHTAQRRKYARGYGPEDLEDYTTTGIRISVVWSLDRELSELYPARGSYRRYYPTGSVTIQVKAHRYNLNSIMWWEKRLPRRWSDRNFLKHAAIGYEAALAYVNHSAPIRKLYERGEGLVTGILNTRFPNGMQVGSIPYNDLRRRIFEWMDKAGKARRLPMFPYAAFAQETWREGLTQAQIDGWNEILDELEEVGDALPDLLDWP
jgi:hypothetical protein